MEHETSQFESSETLAAYLASTPLLEESWRQCRRANVAAQRSFTVDRVGKVAYVAFSGVQTVDCSEGSCRSLVDLESGGAKGIFGSFSGRDQEDPIMVQGGLLQLFLLFYHTPNFQQKMLEILNESKSIVFTGHSLGGALASLSALWLLSVFQTNSPNIDVLCITFGSPMLGNQSFSLAILQERWAGNFFHVVSQYDILPRILFTPKSPFADSDQLRALFDFWHFSMSSSPYNSTLLIPPQLSCENITELFQTVLACVEDKEMKSLLWPFGSYMFCTENGAVCLDNGIAIVKMLCLIVVDKGSVESCVEDHLKYESYVGKVCWNYLRKSLGDTCVSESTNDAGIELALHASGIIHYQEPIYRSAKNCLSMARQLGCRRSLNNAKMAVSLAKITPLRAQIEWYKTFCDNSDDQLGYYDSFKQRAASKRGSKVNMNRIRLGKFWDEVINMMETNQVTHDFHKLPKYVYASQFYKLLVEPLEIAEYYRTGTHEERGHYIEHGRDRKFKIFDKWWRDRKFGDEEGKPRSKFASLTQDSCFWARVEEARDDAYQVLMSGMDSVRMDKIDEFERYARGMIERKEVSLDVLAKNSSYNMFREEWEVVKSRMHGKVQGFCLEAENFQV